MDFYQQTGKMALGTRLRRLSEKLMEDATRVYDLYDVGLDPKWFPVFYVLSHQSDASITGIAHTIGHSHPSVSQIVKEMKQKGLVVTDKSEKDARVNVIRLSSLGRQLIPKIDEQYVDVAQAVEELLSETQHNLWKAIEDIEFLLDEKSFLTRVRNTRRAREQTKIEIIDYGPEFGDDFKQLNYAWIEHYFTIEESDRKYLEHPDKEIIQPGGHILMARYGDNIVGTCALVKMDDTRYELAKMAVAKDMRGRGIGWLLGQSAIDKARDLGANTLYIESNTTLKPAIKLYQKLGFKKIVGHPSPYERCNIQLELKL
ncbi:MAG: bifunctional helix-turn-helix transcriptional regulator/GNAT family N-acetyltransferase [Cyanobacteria bacterium J06627_3]